MGRNDGGVGLSSQNQMAIEEEQPSTSQFHVLAVDDSIVDRKVIERLLKISAYKVTTVESGRRALEYLGLDEEHNSVNIDSLKVKVNMIITDYCMPEMTGYDLLKKIKESSTLKEIPVVIMSSENVLARIDRCLEEGAEEFILKPVKLSDVKRLKGHIVKGLSKEQQQQPQPSSSAKRKSISENLENLPEQPSDRRPRLGLEELTVS
ncbi:hypothetical protein KI387_003298 [Taxus chinensis]|uniref:Response regulatory domain-containing protein n=1 Tax=Taxus chinensis TaxID=29808 RepID=A0AA38LQM7_TAXCH|nr:hypothetical protein KI387_003298 [Taxus chinensis]